MHVLLERRRPPIAHSFRALDAMAAGDLHLWYYRVPPGRSCLMAGSVAWLSAAERARAERLVDPRARDRYRIAHQFLRWVLSSYLDCAEPELSIHRDARGKPVLAARHGRLQFNLSHAGDAVAVAVGCAREVGVDVEWTRQLPRAPTSTLFGLAAAFDAEEAAAIRALPSIAARCEVTRLWTLKEALAKAAGAGLALPLRKAVFPVRGSAAAAGGASRHPGPWSFCCLPLADGGWLSAAIAAQTGRTRIMTLMAILARSARDSIETIETVPRSCDGIPVAPEVSQTHRPSRARPMP